MPQEVYRLRKEHKEALCMAAKCQDHIKKVDQMVKHREATILEVEKARNHMQVQKDKAWADLAKAWEAVREFERAF